MMYIFIKFILVSSGISFLSTCPPARSGSDHAIFFYSTTFQSGWEPLPETKSEAELLADELKMNYGFTAELIPNPSKREIENKLAELKNKEYGSDDQLLLFFSMHGFVENRGYLIPSDGKTPENDPLGKSWLSYDDLSNYLAINPCEHIMLLLDACYSGSFGIRMKGGPTNTPWEESISCEEKVENALRYKSRIFFTSGSKDQRTPAKSLFAKQLLKLLRNGVEKKVIRIKDIRYELSDLPEPKPLGGTFSTIHEEAGDFVFVHKTACSGNQSQDNQHWQSYLSDRSKAQLLEHLNKYPGCAHYQEALKMLTEDSQVNLPEPELDLTNGTMNLPDMVFIKGGTFQMGSNKWYADEKPVHNVTLDDFYLKKYEVTFNEYGAFCKATGKEEPNDMGWGRDSRPVINISWYDAINYCNWLSEKENIQKVYTISNIGVLADWDANGYRLPTEAEWEYVAKGRGEDKICTDTFTEQNLSKYANYWKSGKRDIDGYDYTSPVGSFLPNSLGFYDMSGNVQEWCWDWYDSEFYNKSPEYNPRGPLSASKRRVIRGGSWRSKPEDLCYSSRFEYFPNETSRYTGFRLARSAR